MYYVIFYMLKYNKGLFKVYIYKVLEYLHVS